MRILYFDLDTLRPDHLGCYGYHRNTSPNIDWIASEGVRCENYYTSDAPCLPSRSAMMTGRFGIHNGAINHGGTNADVRLEGSGRGFKSWLSFETLPAFLHKEAGLHTTFIGGFGERHSLFSFYAGFTEIHDTGKSGMESAEDVTPTVLDWIEHNADKDDWYLHVNYWDPHTPYRAPEEFGNPFKDEPLPDWITEDVINYQLKNTVGPHGILDINMYNDNEKPQFPRQPGKVTDMASVRRHIDGYDCGIRYMDEHIGRVLDALRAKGIMDDLIVIVSSDHGENHGELGMWAEHGTADNITCRIPMIIRWPDGCENHADTGLHYNIDLIPTLADMLGKEPFPRWDGRSYADTIRSGADTGRDELILSQCCHGCQRSVRWGDWLYMRTYHDFYHLFPKEMLFNLKDDPYEQHNLAEERPDICREAAAKYLNWHDEMMITQPQGFFHDPMWEVIHEGGPFHARGKLSQYCERLEQTDRSWAIEELKKRHPKEFCDK
ncbi:MAG: sulfatase [Victivallales bacterium]|nr:sulfatase [Victivallales bacterium]